MYCMALISLALAIITDVIGSIMLKISKGFTEMLPTFVFILGFISSSYFFSRALLELPLGLSYAAWSGAGTMLTAVAGVIFFKEKINQKGIIGIGILIIGIVMLHV